MSFQFKKCRISFHLHKKYGRTKKKLFLFSFFFCLYSFCAGYPSDSKNELRASITRTFCCCLLTLRAEPGKIIRSGVTEMHSRGIIAPATSLFFYFYSDHLWRLKRWIYAKECFLLFLFSPIYFCKNSMTRIQEGIAREHPVSIFCPSLY